MENDANFCAPITWDSIDPSQFDGKKIFLRIFSEFSALLLGGGHAPGMRQYLESELLMKKIVEFWSLNKPVAAICHGKNFLRIFLTIRCSSAFALSRSHNSTVFDLY
jgi:hypothetical protein